MIDLCLVNCRLSPHIECNIGIDGGKIVQLKKLPVIADKTMDLNGKLVFPGLIDAHVHFRDPGLTYKEDFRTGSAAAAAGGFTTVIDMPNTNPATNTPYDFQEKLKIAGKKSLVDFGVHAGVQDPTNIRGLAELKPVSFKIFMDLVDTAFLMEVFGELSRVDGTPIISLHSEDRNITRHCTRLMKKEGSQVELYAKARPSVAESVAVATALSMADYFGLKTHICHVSSKESLKLINQAQNEGCPVTTEITPHHLFLDLDYLQKFGTLAKTNPPLRSARHKLGIADLPHLDIIGTDHAPHTLEEKNENVWDAPPGVPGLETTLPLLLTQINRGQISIDDIKRLLCENPARIFNIPGKGFIREGMDADLVVVDLKRENTIKAEDFKSKAKYSPFEGFKVKGMPVLTLVRGRVVMEEGEIYENKGRFVYL
jgi:dihydroorotase